MKNFWECLFWSEVEAAKNLFCCASKLDFATSLILLLNKSWELIGVFLNFWEECSSMTFDEANAALRLAWNNSMANIVDIAVACFIDLATDSKSLDKALTLYVGTDKLLMKINQRGNL